MQQISVAKHKKATMGAMQRCHVVEAQHSEDAPTFINKTMEVLK